MPERVYIKPEDDINEVVGRLVSTQEDSVEVVVPSGARILQNIVDAYLLRDAALENSKEVTILTNDIMGKIFAERAGLSSSTIKDKEKEYIATQTMAKMTDIVPYPRIPSGITWWLPSWMGASSERNPQLELDIPGSCALLVVDQRRMTDATHSQIQPRCLPRPRTWEATGRKAPAGFRGCSNRRGSDYPLPPPWG